MGPTPIAAPRGNAGTPTRRARWWCATARISVGLAKPGNVSTISCCGKARTIESSIHVSSRKTTRLKAWRTPLKKHSKKPTTTASTRSRSEDKLRDAIEAARRDPRQVSLYGPGHTEELVNGKRRTPNLWRVLPATE